MLGLRILLIQILIICSAQAAVKGNWKRHVIWNGLHNNVAVAADFTGDGKIDVKEIEENAIKRLRKEPDEIEQQEETEEETNDEFENLYKGQVSKSGVAILPSKRTRRIPEVKKPSLADEALSELKAEQPEIKEENLDTEESPLELKEEVPAEEEKSE